MRVLLIANTLPDTDISGVGEQVVQLAAGLKSAGHQVRVLGRGPEGAAGSKLLFPVSVLVPFLQVLFSFRPHVVQVHESDGALVALLTKTLQAGLEPAPLVVALLQVSYLEELRSVRPLRDGGQILGRPSVQEYLFRWFKAPLQVLFGLLTGWLADRVLAPSRQTALEIERDYGIEDVGVLPNVTGAGGLRQPDEIEPEGEPDEYLLFVGRLRIRKGLEVLLHALARLAAGEETPQLLVVGDGEHRQRIETVVADLDLDGRVRLLGRVASDRVPALMSRARALVVPSIYEGMPLVILEAMAAGLPVVASRVSGVPEVVQDGETGWLVPPEDVAALTTALAEVLAQPDEARRRGRRGRQLVRQRAQPADAAERWESGIRSLASRGHQDG